MKNKIGIKAILIILIILFLLNIPKISANNNQEKICAVYITGIGCPNCAVTDPALLLEYVNENPNLIIIEYEIYHQREDNIEIANQYFQNYIPNTRAGVPLIIFNKNQYGLGRFDVLDSKNTIKKLDSNKCPLPNGSSIKFEDLDITSLKGKPKIWVANSILISQEGGGDNQELKKVLNQEPSLSKKEFKKATPQLAEISKAKVEFKHAVQLNGWIFQWDGEISNNEDINHLQKFKVGYLIIGILIFFIILFLTYNFFVKKKVCCIPHFTLKQKRFLIIGIAVLALIGFFILAKNISPDFLKSIGYNLPLPIFTFFIALIDGFNPCNLFVLTFLLGLLVSASHSRKKIYAIGYTFVIMVFIIYFLFMAAWLNIFKYIGFITPLRITIACIALIAGIINCKELIAFRKGVTLMIQEKHKAPLVRKIENMKEIITNGSMPALILASIGLATFASLVELPCTAGFPIIYTGILTGKVLASSLSYYSYLLFYNLIYVIPLIVIITIFGYTFKTKQISKRQMQIIKFIGGLIMILLGIILLINPGLIGIGFG